MIPVYIFARSSLGLLGLPLATTLALSVYTVGLVLLLRRRFPGVSDGFGPYLARMVPAVALGIGAGLALARYGGLPGPLLRGALAGLLGGAVYAGSALAIGVPELREVGGMVMRRLRRGRG